MPRVYRGRASRGLASRELLRLRHGRSLPQARPDQHWPSLLPGQTVSSPYSIIIDRVATNNITGRRYVDHWSEAGFECATLIENTNSQRGSGGETREPRASESTRASESIRYALRL